MSGLLIGTGQPAPGEWLVSVACFRSCAATVHFNNSPVLLIGVRTPAAKPGVCADWVPDTTDIVPAPSSLNTMSTPDTGRFRSFWMPRLAPSRQRGQKCSWTRRLIRLSGSLAALKRKADAIFSGPSYVRPIEVEVSTGEKLVNALRYRICRTAATICIALPARPSCRPDLRC